MPPSCHNGKWLTVALAKETRLDTLKHALKIAVTVMIGMLAAYALWQLYDYYTYAPQTRDGMVRADVVSLAPDVSGSVATVLVHEDQSVRRGQLLFVIDRARLANAVDQDRAAVALAQATLSAAQRKDQRGRLMTGIISAQDQDDRATAVAEASARLDQAVADLGLAQINLDGAEVVAPVNGIVTNFSLRPGDYATAGQPVMALVDSDSYYVDGYFEETKLANIYVGARVTIRLMGEPRTLSGHVVGLSAGIDDAAPSASGSLLANVSPTFSWIRLAQRIPVRIAIDHAPPGVALIAGRTASVTLDGTDDSQHPQGQ
jgi:multidrug resistance efflux pump